MPVLLTPSWFNNINISLPQLGLTDEQYNNGVLGTYDAGRIIRVTGSTMARYCNHGIIKATRSFSVNPTRSVWQITPKDLHDAIKKYSYPKEGENHE